MIKMSSLWAVEPLTTKLTSKQLQLEPLSQSPLSALVKATYSPRLDLVDDVPVVERIQKASSDADVGGEVEHDVVMAELRTLVGESVQKTLTTAKDVVNPLITRSVERLQERLARESQKLLVPFEIQPVNYARVWRSPALGDVVERYAEQPVLPVLLPAVMPELSEETLLGYLQTGISSFDSEVRELINSKPSGWLVALFDSIFTAKGSKDNLDRVLTVSHDVRDEVLVVYLLTRRLKEDPPEGVRQDLGEYRSRMALLMNQSGRCVARLLSLRERERKVQTLVYSWPQGSLDAVREGNCVIRVNGELYLEWLNAGGQPEVLFGAFLDNKVRTYDVLLEKAESYKTLWERQLRVLRTKVAFQEQNLIMSGLERVGTDLIEEVRDAHAVDAAQLHSRLQKVLKDIRTDELTNLYKVSRKVICRVLFAHTDVELLLTSIDRQCELNPDIPVREAALLATIQYVTDWACKLVQVKYVG